MDRKPDQFVIISRTLHEFSDQKFDLETHHTLQDGSETWSDLVQFWVGQTFRNAGQKSDGGPGTFPVKTHHTLQDGQKDGCTADPET